MCEETKQSFATGCKVEGELGKMGIMLLNQYLKTFMGMGKYKKNYIWEKTELPRIISPLNT